MDGWFTVSGVPIMDEHVRSLKDGKQIVMDRKQLETMAKVNQERYLDTGDESPVVADFEYRRGHTRGKGDSLPNPEVVGFAKNWRVVDGFGKLKPRAALVCDMRFEEKDREKLRKFPRRSVEWFPSDNIIDPISLLGAEAPVRSLGLMQFSRDDERLCYSMDDAMLTQEPDAGIPNLDGIIQAVMNAFANSPMGQYIAGKMQAEEPQEDPATPDPTPEPEPAPAPDVQPEPPKEEEPEQMSRTRKDVELDDLKVRFSRMENELSEYKDRAVKAEKSARRAVRERTLTQLGAEGYKFSRADELTHVEDMTDKQFEKHVERIRQNYKKAPVAPLPVMYGRNGEEIADGGDGRMDTGPVQFSREDGQKALDLVREKGISFDEAREQIIAAKKAS